MQSQAFDWNGILREVGVRFHPLYPQLEKANFETVVRSFEQDLDPYHTLANYLLYGAAAVLGRHQAASNAALSYHNRLNTKTKAVSLYFWAEEAIAHQQYQTAEGLILPLLEAYPKDPFLNAAMATICYYSQNLSRGMPYLQKGLESHPSSAPLNSLLCRYRLGGGDLEGAQKAALQLLQIEPYDGVALNTLSRVEPAEISSDILERFEVRALSGTLGPVTSAGIFFDLGRVYEAQGRYAKAFDFVEEANKCMRTIPQVSGQEFDADNEYQRFENHCTLFDQLDPCKLPTGLTPVFIIGLPRTGSTLLDQAMSAHPETVSLGEDDIIPRLVEEADALLTQGKVTDAQRNMRVWKAKFADHARERARVQNPAGPSTSVRFVVDKMLGNSRNVGFLQKLFPEARFINTRRNPMDVGLSIYFSPLHRANTYATDQSKIGDYINLEHQVMAYWHGLGVKIHPVKYEMLVDDFEPTLRGVMQHIGMAWHDDCLKFHEVERPVYTYSAHQVRRKIYTQSVGRWQNYAAQLLPLAQSLELDIAMPRTTEEAPAIIPNSTDEVRLSG